MDPKNRKLVFGVGINDADYLVTKREEIDLVDGKRKQKLVWKCPYYQTWTNMLSRCYSVKTQDRQPTYQGCSVTEEWYTFSHFRAWMEKQDFEGKQLDKDLLFEGNKLYSPDTCVFVTQTVNLFTNDYGAKRGKWLIGVYWDKNKNKFRAQCHNPLSRKREHLGSFDSEHEAHNAWANRKLELAQELAAIQTDPRVANALIDRYLPQVRD